MARTSIKPIEIPEGVSLRVPFPLMESLQDYQTKVDNYILQNGRE